jgi:D-3-phosphoglycerate dehydrogenase
MIGMKEQYLALFESKGIDVVMPNVTQTLPEQELVRLVPEFDGWIIGDDPATFNVVEAGSKGKLKAAVKWGVGVDNIDFDAFQKFNIKITNTPKMFGAEVADVALAYIIGLARDLFFIDREVRKNNWVKPRGLSLAGKKIAVVGYGDIGSNLARRLLSLGIKLGIYVNSVEEPQFDGEYDVLYWPDRINEYDFIVFTCSLNDKNYHMLDENVLKQTKRHVRIINVARGALIDEEALIRSLLSGHVKSVALDVMEQEPLPENSLLRSMDHCIFGSHNSSNTKEAVEATNMRAIGELFKYLGVS